MPLRTAFFLAVFGLFAMGGLLWPHLSLLGYVAHYLTGPEDKWWSRPIAHWGIRYSYTLALVTIIGFFVHMRYFKPAGSWLCRQEKLLLVFLGIVWLSTLLGPDTVGRYTTVDHPSLKFTKVAIFALLMTHIINNRARLETLLWALVACAFILGWQAYDEPRRNFISGRLEGIGGPDFAESNFFSAFMAAMLPLIGVMFLRSGWVGKAVTLFVGAFAANAIVLTRSRGAFVGIGAGAMVAALVSPRKYRLPVIAGLIVAMAGGYYLSDEQFRDRMTTINRSEQERDPAAQSRIELARAGLQMLRDRPYGIGAGNFYQTIGRYAPMYEGMDAHNTYVRCATELGVQGIVLLGIIIGNAFWMLRTVLRAAHQLPPPEERSFTLLAFGMGTALVTLLACTLTVSLPYVEYYWWFMLLPVCLERAMQRRLADLPAGFPVVIPPSPQAKALHDLSPT